MRPYCRPELRNHKLAENDKAAALDRVLLAPAAPSAAAVAPAARGSKGDMPGALPGLSLPVAPLPSSPKGLALFSFPVRSDGGSDSTAGTKGEGVFDMTKQGCESIYRTNGLSAAPRHFDKMRMALRMGPSHAPLDSAVVRGPEDVALVHRIAMLLADTAVFDKVTASAFYAGATDHDAEAKHKVSLAAAQSKSLPFARLPFVLEHLQIPLEHSPVIDTLLHRERHFQQQSDVIDFETFQAVLVKAFRRIRDKFCVRFSKEQFVTRNRRKLEEEYEENGECGKGFFGQCFWVCHKQTKDIRVVKNISKMQSQVPREEIEKEMDILKNLDHPHVVRMFEWFETDRSFQLVMEAARGGDLDKELRRRRDAGHVGLDEPFVQTLTWQALTALTYVHSKHVIHRDLKPANMILTKANMHPPHLLLADFGIADIFGSQAHFESFKKGTWAYMAPEIFDDMVSPKSDVWALGVVIYELLSGKRPFGVSPFEVHVALSLSDDEADLVPLRECGVSETACSFVKWLLTKEEASRPTAQEAVPFCTQPPGGGGRTSLVNATTVEGLQGFQKSSTFSKAILLCLASQLDTSSLDEVTHEYEKMDINGDSTLTVAEFVAGLTKCGIDESTVDSLVDSLDVDGNGLVSYSEFCAAAIRGHAELVDSALLHAFTVFDIDGDGYISMDELRTILTAEGNFAAVLPDGNTLESILAELDTSLDGQVSYDEFKTYLDKQLMRPAQSSTDRGLLKPSKESDKMAPRLSGPANTSRSHTFGVSHANTSPSGAEVDPWLRPESEVLVRQIACTRLAEANALRAACFL